MSPERGRFVEAVRVVIVLLIVGAIYGLIALVSYYPHALEMLPHRCFELQPRKLREARPAEPRWQPWPPGWVCDYHLPDERTVTLDFDDLVS